MQASPVSVAAISDDELDPGRVAQRLEHQGEPFGLLVIECTAGQR